MVCEEIITILEAHSPTHYASSWDNVGLLVGNGKKQVSTVLVALDLTEEALQKALEVKADFIVTHHPLIFSPRKRITTDDVIGNRIYQLIRNDISYYAMHTNFDVKGMAELAANRMQILNPSVLEVTTLEEKEEGFGRIGELLEEITLKECCEKVKKNFQLSEVKVFGDLDFKVKQVAISPGSGKSMISVSQKKGAHVLITGDIDHHDGMDAWEAGLAIIDAGHHGIEQIFVKYMKDYIESKAKDIVVHTYNSGAPYKIL